MPSFRRLRHAVVLAAAAAPLAPLAAQATRVDTPGAAPPPERPAHWMVEARSADGRVASIDYGDPAAPVLSIGASIAMGELQWHGLVEESAATLAGRAFNCPSCGAPVENTIRGGLGPTELTSSASAQPSSRSAR